MSGLSRLGQCKYINISSVSWAGGGLEFREWPGFQELIPTFFKVGEFLTCQTFLLMLRVKFRNASCSIVGLTFHPDTISIKIK